MRRLPFKFQLTLGPILIAATLVGLIWYTLMQFDDLRRQNEVIRQWTRVTDRMHLAISAGHQMRSLSERMLQKTSDHNDVQFSYLEQSRVFADNVTYPECFDRFPREIRKKIEIAEPDIRFSDEMSPTQVIATLDTLLPQLDELYDNWWLQKRAAYITYYEDVQQTINHYITVSLTILAVCLFLAGGATLWTLRTTNTRLKKLAQQTQAVSEGKLSVIQPPAQCIDEIDNAMASVSQMTDRLLKVVAVEKVLQGAEEERRRIAMDMHDQVLAELTTIGRQMDSMQQSTVDVRDQLPQLREGITQTIQAIREVIDNLHPNVLDMLGLASAVRALTERVCKGPQCPTCYLSIDEDIDKYLNNYVRIMLYRIIQELINNLIRHARCTQFEVRIHRQGNQLLVVVEDNGLGFDAAKVASGRGLANINERARVIGGKAQWKPSRFTSGSCFELTLPINSL